MFVEFQHLMLSEGLVTQKTQVDKIITQAGETLTGKIKAKEIAQGIEGIINARWVGLRPLTPRDKTLLVLMAEDAIVEKALQDAADKTKKKGISNAEGKKEKIVDISREISKVNKVTAMVLNEAADYKAPANAVPITKEDVDYIVNEIASIDKVELKDVHTLLRAARNE